MIIGKDYDIVEELKFRFTKEMADLVFESMKIKEQMNNEKINNHEKEKLEKKFIDLRNKFIKEFQKNNVEEIKKYNELKKIIITKIMMCCNILQI